MATTDARLAGRVLDHLSAVGVGFVVLHGEDGIARGDHDRDVDLLVDRPAADVVRALAPALAADDLFIVSVFSYEVDELTVFVSDATASGAAQIDLLHDTEGRSIFGLLGRRLLADAVPGTRWPVPDPLDGALYVLRKAHVKGQRDRMAVQADTALALADDLDGARRRIDALFAPWAATDLAAAAADPAGCAPMRRSPAYRARTLARRLGRLRRPAGAWVHVTGGDAAEVADDLHARFRNFLVRATVAPLPQPATRWWWMRHVAPTRWRPGLAVTHGTPSAKGPRPDVTITLGERDRVDSAANALVRELHHHRAW